MDKNTTTRHKISELQNHLIASAKLTRKDNSLSSMEHPKNIKLLPDSQEKVFKRCDILHLCDNIRGKEENEMIF
jgi:hypothetical protein